MEIGYKSFNGPEAQEQKQKSKLFQFTFRIFITSEHLPTKMASIKKELYVIPSGSRVLVTGANGYIGSHVVQELLSLGYIVRGTVRSEKPWLDEFFKSKFGPNSFESTVIPDLSNFHSLSKAMRDVSGVIHVVYIRPL